MLFRSTRSLARRAAAAGAAAALTLTLFNLAQPTLGNREPDPGTVKDVQVALAPVPSVDNRGLATAQAAPDTGARLQSAPIEVGEARFVGFSWPDQAAGTLWLRSRSGSAWSGWREVEPAGDGPDATSREYRPGRRFSDGQWLPAGTDELQVRSAGPAGGLTAHLVSPDMTPTPGTEPPRAGVATAATAQPAIVSRAAWRARESIRRAAPDYSRTVKAAIVHHTVQSNSYSPSESAALVRADYLYHVNSRGWNDIGYNFLVDRYGRVFEGRYGGITRAVLGAHSGGFNTETTGVAMLGTFTTAAPPAAMRAALQRLLAWKLDLTHVDPRGRTVLTSRGGANVRYPAGHRLATPTILGHRSTSYTTCPGSPTLARLAAIRRAVSVIGRPKIYGGAVSTSRILPSRGGTVGVGARFSARLRWRITVTGSHGGVVRSWSGTGTRASVRWNGRTAGGALAPPGWATVRVTASGGGTARPASSRVYVDHTPPSGTSTGGFSRGRWSVSNVNAEQLTLSSRAFATLRWGVAGDIPIVGDWDGDGTHTVGIVRRNTAAGTSHFALRNADGSRIDFQYGSDRGRPVVGDWDGDGSFTPGMVTGGVWSLRNSNTAGDPDLSFRFGRGGDRYLAGDWDGDGVFTPGVQRAGVFAGRNSNTSGPSQFRVAFGRPDDSGFVGDWNDDGRWSPGVLRAGTRWYLKNSFSGGAAAVGLKKQTPGTPVVGNWDNLP